MKDVRIYSTGIAHSNKQVKAKRKTGENDTPCSSQLRCVWSNAKPWWDTHLHSHRRTQNRSRLRGRSLRVTRSTTPFKVYGLKSQAIKVGQNTETTKKKSSNLCIRNSRQVRSLDMFVINYNRSWVRLRTSFMWMQKRSVNASTAPKAQHDPQWPWSKSSTISSRVISTHTHTSHPEQISGCRHKHKTPFKLLFYISCIKRQSYRETEQI